MPPIANTVSSDGTKGKGVDSEYDLQELASQTKRKRKRGCFSGKKLCVVNPVVNKQNSNSGMLCINDRDVNRTVVTLLLVRDIEKCSDEDLGSLLKERGATAVQLEKEINSIQGSLYNACQKLSTLKPCEAGAIDDSSGRCSFVKAEKDKGSSSKSMRMKSRSDFIDKALVLPGSISDLIDSICELIKISKEKILVAQDITLCVEMIKEAENGVTLMALIEASVESETIGLPAIHELQKDGEDKMTNGEFTNLQRYFREEVFNGKKVGFNFQELSQYICLRHALETNSFIEHFPEKLVFFIKYLIDKVLRCRGEQTASLKRPQFFKEVVDKSGVPKSFVDFFTELLRENINLEALNDVVKRLGSLSHNALSIDQEAWEQATCRSLTMEEGVLLIDFFKSYFFQKWLLAFSMDDLKKHMAFQSLK